MGKPKDKWRHLSVRQLVSLYAFHVCISDARGNSQPVGVDAGLDADCHDIPPGSVSCHGLCVVGLVLDLGEGWIWVTVGCGEGPGANLQRGCKEQSSSSRCGWELSHLYRDLPLHGVFHQPLKGFLEDALP